MATTLKMQDLSPEELQAMVEIMHREITGEELTPAEKERIRNKVTPTFCPVCGAKPSAFKERIAPYHVGREGIKKVRIYFCTECNAQIVPDEGKFNPWLQEHVPILKK